MFLYLKFKKNYQLHIKTILRERVFKIDIICSIYCHRSGSTVTPVMALTGALFSV